MGLYEFNILSEHDKYNAVFSKATFVDSVSDQHIDYVIYSLSYFWVEIQYNSKNNSIVGINSFVSGKSLNRYSNIPKSF